MAAIARDKATTTTRRSDTAKARFFFAEILVVKVVLRNTQISNGSSGGASKSFRVCGCVLLIQLQDSRPVVGAGTRAVASEMTPSLGTHASWISVAAMIWAHMVIAKTSRAAHVGLKEYSMSPAHFHLPASFTATSRQ